MHEQLWEKLVGLDPLEMAERGGCRCLQDDNKVVVPLLNRDYLVDLSGKSVILCSESENGKAAQYPEQLCILAYLLNSKEIPLSGKIVTADKLEAGQFFFRGPHLLPTQKLEQVFGTKPDSLYAASNGLISQKKEFGDASVEVQVLPRLPVIFVIWGTDDQFNARASILFDETASLQMPLDALMVAVNLAVKAIVDSA